MPGGRPPKYRKDFHPQSFIEHSKQGKHLYQIAYEWDVCRDVLYQWQAKHSEFNDAVKKGKQYAEAWYMNLGHRAMLGQVTINGKPVVVNLGWFCYLTKNKFKWSDRMEIDQKVQETHDPQEIKNLIQWLKDSSKHE